MLINQTVFWPIPDHIEDDWNNLEDKNSNKSKEVDADNNIMTESHNVFQDEIPVSPWIGVELLVSQICLPHVAPNPLLAP